MLLLDGTKIQNGYGIFTKAEQLWAKQLGIPNASGLVAPCNPFQHRTIWRGSDPPTHSTVLFSSQLSVRFRSCQLPGQGLQQRNGSTSHQPVRIIPVTMITMLPLISQGIQALHDRFNRITFNIDHMVMVGVCILIIFIWQDQLAWTKCV